MLACGQLNLIQFSTRTCAHVCILGMVSTHTCVKLAELHAMSVNVSPVTVYEGLRLLIPESTYVEQIRHDFDAWYIAEEAKLNTTVITVLEPYLLKDIVGLIALFIGTCLFEDREQEIVDSVYQPRSTSWIFADAKTRGPSRTILNTIAWHGTYPNLNTCPTLKGDDIARAKIDYCFLVREFCRVHGEMGLQYYLSKCTPLYPFSSVINPVNGYVLLEAINMSLEVLGKVSSRCDRVGCCGRTGRQKRARIV